MAKDTSGEIASSLPVRRWRDNLPMIQLKELFNVNHFIVSQANPHIAPFLRLKEIVRAYGGNFSAKLAHLAEMEVKHRCHQLLEPGFPLGGLAKLFAQDWGGGVMSLFYQPSQRCTWEKLSAIKSNCGIELALDECVALLNHMRWLKRSSERATASHRHGLASTIRFNASKRIPSWNCVARENSTGSLEEDVISKVVSRMHRAGGGSTGKNFPVHRNIHDGSDSDSESIDLNSWTRSGKNFRVHRNIHDGSDSDSESIDLNSWTRSGGPLMRTASANKFVDYVQNLDADSELNKSSWTRGEDEVKGVTVPPNIIIQMVSGDSYYRSSSRVTTPDRNPEIVDWDQRRGYHITITEGDLLQPERRSGHESDTYHSSSPSAAAECVQLEPLGKEMDSGSTSETEDEKVIP
ncbi:hypothetical protein MKW92_024240 [Papaver armeniacum]|nr:hypothetical protein MKW92_024240 [Papaver armeniacum]